jgi:hypothetical protein
MSVACNPFFIGLGKGKACLASWKVRSLNVKCFWMKIKLGFDALIIEKDSTKMAGEGNSIFLISGQND